MISEVSYSCENRLHDSDVCHEPALSSIKFTGIPVMLLSCCRLHIGCIPSGEGYQSKFSVSIGELGSWNSISL